MGQQNQMKAAAYLYTLVVESRCPTDTDEWNEIKLVVGLENHFLVLPRIPYSEAP